MIISSSPSLSGKTGFIFSGGIGIDSIDSGKIGFTPAGSWTGIRIT
jgi:hypothetical protein